MKNYMGIDVSSKKLNIHITGPKVFDFEIPNDEKSLKDFLEEQRINSGDYIVGAESTGRYHLVCQEIFVKKGFEFRVLNPILTGNKIRASIRKKKTDINDAKIIANLLIQGEGNKVTKKQLDLTKRTVLRTRSTVIKHKSAMSKVVKDLNKVKSNPRIVEAVLSLEKVIGEMEKCVKELEDNAFNREPATRTEELIQTIPGFATRLSAVVACEVGDFNRFPSATQFKAYVGIDPKVTQSGNSLKTGRITKRGNPHLRSAFYLAAQVARVHDPELKQFFEKKIREGKSFRVAVCATARKLCERVYAIVTKDVPYEIRQPSLT